MARAFGVVAARSDRSQGSSRDARLVRTGRCDRCTGAHRASPEADRTHREAVHGRGERVALQHLNRTHPIRQVKERL